MEEQQRGRVRVVLDFSGQAYERLELLRAVMGHLTRAEVIREALALLEHAVHLITEDGGVLLAQRGEQVSELVLPFMHEKGEDLLKTESGSILEITESDKKFLKDIGIDLETPPQKTIE